MDSITAASKFSFFLVSFLFFPTSLLSYDEIRLYLPPKTLGPEAGAFDRAGGGPYTGVLDGRVLKYVNQTLGFVDFATTMPNRPKQLCDGNLNPLLEPTCGRPLGLGFGVKSRNLYIAEPYRGLVVVGPEGGIANLLSSSDDGVPYRFLNALDIYQNDEIVYFVDSSTVFQRSQYLVALAARDSTGRLLKYDPRTRQVTTLLSKLGLPVGTAVSRNGDFVLVTEAVNRRALRYWLRGPKANTSEVFATFTGQPDNIKRNPRGEFWVPVNNVNRTLTQSVALRIDEDGNVKETFELKSAIPVPQYSEFQEFLPRRFFIGSLNRNYVGLINLT